MNLEKNKVRSTFRPDADLMSDLALQIQKKAGIEIVDIFPVSKPINIKTGKRTVSSVQPIQLSVEFGKSYVAAKPEETYLSEEILNPVVIDQQVQETAEAEIPMIEESVEQEILQISDLPENSVLETSIVADRPIELPLVEITIEKTEEKKQREAEIAVKRAQAAARYAELLEDSRTPQPEVNAESVEKFRFPWPTFLGITVSVMAIFCAWWVWQILQTPMSVEQIALNSVTQNTKISVDSNRGTKGAATSALDDTEFVLIDFIVDSQWNESKVPAFVDLDEQSKISLVQLEKNNVLNLSLESDLFNSIEL